MPRRRNKRKGSSDEDYQNSSDDENDAADFKYVPVKTEIVEGSDGETFDFVGGQVETRASGSSSSRPKRKASVKTVVQIKEEPCDPVTSDSDAGVGFEGEGDSDYLMKEDEEENEVVKKKRRSGGTSKRKKVSEMSEEEREAMKAKWREEARLQRAKRREAIGVKKNEENKKRSNGTCKRKKVSEMTEEEREAMKIKWREEARQRRAKKRESMGVASGSEGEEKILNRSQSQYKRKPVAEMSEEERQRMKEKWRKEARQRRAKKKEMMTEEEKREEQKKTNKQRKLLRWKKMEAEGKKVRVKKEGGEKGKRKPLTEEEKAKKREWRRKWRENMTEEEKEIRRERWRIRRRELREGMTVEERRMKTYMERQARLARMTKEEREAEKERLKRRRYDRMGGKEGHKEYQRRWREGMSDEQKDRFRRQLRESYYRKMDRIKRDPEKLQEWRDKCKENYQRKVMKSLMTGIPMRKSRKGILGGGGGSAPRYRDKEEWRKQLENTKLWRKRQEIRRRLEIQKMLEEGLNMEEIYKKLDPYGGDEEKRRRRLVRQRVNKQKLNLRRQLEGMGVEEEEIKRRVQEVEDTYQPTFQFRPYKLHSKSLEPVGPDELKLLEEEEQRQKMGRFRTGSLFVAPPRPRAQEVRSPEQSQSPPSARPPQTSQPHHHPPPQQSLPQPKQQYVSLPHQQSTSAPHQSTYSLEHFLHGMGSNYSTTGHHHLPCSSVHYPSTSTSTQHHHHLQNSPPPATSHQAAYQHYESSYSSSQHEYQQSNYTNSPPPSSPLGDDHDDNYEDDHHHTHTQFLYNNPPQPPVVPLPVPVAPPVQQPTHSQPQQVTRRGRPKKPKRSLPHRKGTRGPPSGPRGPKRGQKEILRDVICEDCGNAYSRQYITEHKMRFHNPNYVNGKCLPCGESFTNAKFWYRHFLKLHIDKDRANDPRKKRQADPNVTGLFCEICGVGFSNRGSLTKHLYYAHGDGVKKENYLKCYICPGEEKLFKSIFSLKNHMRNQHPNSTNEIVRECFRCEMKFRWEEGLSEHVKREHPESYFPCTWCKACRFSKCGLYFHLRRCKRGGRAEVIPEGESLLEQDLECEFCGKGMKMTSLARHYKEIHEVREMETFKCTEEGCKGKGGTGKFRRRDYWVVHLEEKHGKKWDELREWVGKCNVESREGLVVANEKGRKKMPEGGVRRVKYDVEDDEDEDDDEPKIKRKRRNIKVIAEEDEQ